MSIQQRKHRKERKKRRNSCLLNRLIIFIISCLNTFWSRATLYKIPAHWWIPVCTQSQWSSQVCPKKTNKKKKIQNTENIVIFQCWFVSHAGKTPKIYKLGEFVRWNEGFSPCWYLYFYCSVCQETVLPCVVVLFEFFVSVLVPRARWHPVKPALIPCVVSRGGCWTVNEISVT